MFALSGVASDELDGVFDEVVGVVFIIPHRVAIRIALCAPFPASGVRGAMEE